MNSVENTRSHRRGQRGQSAAQLQRDAALVRVTRTRRFVIGGAAALSAGIAALVSAIAPGHSFGAKAAEAATQPRSESGNSSTAHASVTPKKMPPLAKPSDLGLSGPASGPTAPSGSGSNQTGNSGAGPAQNSGSSGNSGAAGSSGNSGNSGNTGVGSTGNTGPSGNSGPAPQAAPAPAPVTSGGS
jgi:hypothetical protein